MIQESCSLFPYTPKNNKTLPLLFIYFVSLSGRRSVPECPPLVSARATSLCNLVGLQRQLKDHAQILVHPPAWIPRVTLPLRGGIHIEALFPLTTW